MSNGSLLKKDFFILLKSAITSINPAALVTASLELKKKNNSNDYLSISNSLSFSCGERADANAAGQHQKILLNKNIYVLAFGKAALGMSSTIEKLIGSNNIVTGVAIVPYNDAQKFFSTRKDENQIFPVENSQIQYYYGGENNLPDLNSCKATLKAYEMCAGLTENDLLLTLISGGGSALFALPVDIGASLQESLNIKLNTIKALVNAGATINELNIVRSCLSKVKAGQLSKLACPAQVVSLVISDVIGDPLEIIASGPTCTSLIDSDKAQRSLGVINKYNLSEKLPKEIMKLMDSKTPRDNVEAPNVYKSLNYLIGSNKKATNGILSEIVAKGLDYSFSVVLSNSVAGEAKTIGLLFAYLVWIISKNKSIIKNFDYSDKALVDHCICDIEQSMKEMGPNFLIQDGLERLNLMKEFLEEILKNNFRHKFKFEKGKRICLITGGETIVSGGEINLMTSSSSKGGRCQEMTLAFEYTINLINKIGALDLSELLFSSFGSDGIDGPTDAAGAFSLLNNKNRDSEIMEQFLKRHDSYNYFLKEERLIKTGSTGTNVSDIQILLVEF